MSGDGSAWLLQVVFFQQVLGRPSTVDELVNYAWAVPDNLVGSRLTQHHRCLGRIARRGMLLPLLLKSGAVGGYGEDDPQTGRHLVSSW